MVKNKVLQNAFCLVEATGLPCALRQSCDQNKLKYSCVITLAQYLRMKSKKGLTKHQTTSINLIVIRASFVTGFTKDKICYITCHYVLFSFRYFSVFYP